MENIVRTNGAFFSSGFDQLVNILRDWGQTTVPKKSEKILISLLEPKKREKKSYKEY